MTTNDSYYYCVLKEAENEIDLSTRTMPICSQLVVGGVYGFIREELLCRRCWGRILNWCQIFNDSIDIKRLPLKCTSSTNVFAKNHQETIYIVYQ